MDHALFRPFGLGPQLGCFTPAKRLHKRTEQHPGAAMTADLCLGANGIENCSRVRVSELTIEDLSERQTFKRTVFFHRAERNEGFRMRQARSRLFSKKPCRAIPDRPRSISTARSKSDGTRERTVPDAALAPEAASNIAIFLPMSGYP